MIKAVSPLVLLVVITLLFNGCATVSSPTGGPRDQTPPRLVSITVSSGSVNFQGKTIIMTFNEYIKLNNPGQNIYSSPPLGNSVSFVTRKNKLFVAFKDSLEANTTYHLNFGSSIQDVNEGNPLTNYQFVFATGPEIDSLSVSGMLEPVNDIKLTANTLIGLYKEQDDSAFLSKAPFYFTFVEDDGSFKLDYLKAGTYQFTAVSDANNNFYYDLPNEAIGFADSLFELTADTANNQMLLFLPENAEIRIQSFTNVVSDYKIVYELSRSLATGQTVNTYMISDSLELECIHQLSEDRTKITSWLSSEFGKLASFQSVLVIDEAIDDTFQHSVSNIKKPIPSISLNGSEFSKLDSIILTSASPMYRVCENIALIDTLKGDTLQLKASQSSDFETVVKISNEVEEEIVYTLLIPDSCLSSIWDQYFEKKSYELRIVSEESRGTLIFNFEGIQPDYDYLVTLMNERGDRIQDVVISSGSSPWIISNLTEGVYKLKITEDENRNGVWNSGSYQPKRYPERIYEYPQDFTVRPNWELEETVKFNIR